MIYQLADIWDEAKTVDARVTGEKLAATLKAANDKLAAAKLPQAAPPETESQKRTKKILIGVAAVLAVVGAVSIFRRLG